MPALGAVFTLEVTNTPAMSLTWIGLGTRIDAFGQTTLPLELQAAGLAGCYLWMAPAIFMATTAVGGAEQVAVSIPANPSLSGSLLAAQGVTLDPASSNGFGGVSNAVVGTLR